MEQQQRVQALQSLRERIRAVCVHDQAQWDTTWTEALDDFSNTRRILLPPDVFFEVLEANSVLLVRSDVRLLLWKFQEQNGAIAAAKFLRWVALNAPVDHVNPELLFPQLPQPYRRIKKVFDRSIFDVAWDIITAESVRYQTDGTTVQSSKESSRANHEDGSSQSEPRQPRNDFDDAKKRYCEPTWHYPLDSGAQQVVGLASHCLLSLVIAGINIAATENSVSNGPLLRAVSTANEDATVAGDFPIEFPTNTPTPEGAAGIVTTIHVAIKKISDLQLVNGRQNGDCCCLAVHLVETTTFQLVDTEANPDVQPPVPTARECVNVYGIRIKSTQELSTAVTATPAFSCQLIAIITPTQSSTEPSIAFIVLSPDSMFLTVTTFNSTVIALYCLEQEESNQDAETERQPLLLSTPTLQADLATTRSPFADDEGGPAIHFCVVPASSSSERRVVPLAPPKTYAFAVCYGLTVSKFLLPPTAITSSPAAPILLTPVKAWEHLTKISASAQDITTQYLVVGCENGTIVVWDVLQDTDFAFHSPFDNTGEPSEPTQSNSSEITCVAFSSTGFVTAQSKSPQRLYFFDVRERGKNKLLRVISPPGTFSSTGTREAPSHSTVTMTSLAVIPDIPVALVEFSNGMVVVYDVRSAEAIGSFWSAAKLTTSAKAYDAIASTEPESATCMAGNQEVLGIATSSSPPADTGIKLFSWRDIFLTCCPSFEGVLQQRQEEMTSSNAKQLFLSINSDETLTTTTSVGPLDVLQNMFLSMAGDPMSLQRTANSLAGVSFSQSPLRQNSTFYIPDASTRTPSAQGNIDRCADSPVMLEPLIPDVTAFFEEYCRQYLDPLVIADKESKLHRKRRDLLRTMSAGGVW